MKQILVVVMVALAVPGFAQDFDAVLSGKAAPLTMSLKDLNGDWRRLSVQSKESSGGGLGDIMGPIMQAAMMSQAGKGGSKPSQDDMMGMMFMSSLFGGGGDSAPVYYTKGQTVGLAGETFLVTYKLKKSTPNIMEMAMQAGASGKEPDMAKLMAGSKVTGDTALVLSLLNVKAIAGISEVKPFDLAKEIEEANKGGSLMDMVMQQATPAKSTQPAPVQKAKPIKKKPGT